MKNLEYNGLLCYNLYPGAINIYLFRFYYFFYELFSLVELSVPRQLLLPIFYGVILHAFCLQQYLHLKIHRSYNLQQ